MCLNPDQSNQNRWLISQQILPNQPPQRGLQHIQSSLKNKPHNHSHIHSTLTTYSLPPIAFLKANLPAFLGRLPGRHPALPNLLSVLEALGLIRALLQPRGWDCLRSGGLCSLPYPVGSLPSFPFSLWWCLYCWSAIWRIQSALMRKSCLPRLLLPHHLRRLPS